MRAKLSPMERMDKLNQISMSMCKRYAESQQLDDELAERRRQRKIWINVIVAQKMHARALEQIYSDYTRKLERIHRVRKLSGDDTLLYVECETLEKLLKHIQGIRRQNGRWFLNIGDWLQHWKIRLSEAELKTALTVPDAAWKEHEPYFKGRTINEVTFVAGIGDDAICKQVHYEMVQALLEADEKTQSHIRWHTQRVFGHLFT